MTTLLLLAPHLEPLFGELEPQHEVLRAWRQTQLERLGAVEVVVATPDTPPPPELLARLPALRWVSMFTAGYDGVDVAGLRARGVEVTHAPGVNAEDVADHALGQILNHHRRLAAGHAQVLSGRWSAGPRPLTATMAGLKVGVVGLGAIGRALGRRLEVCRARLAWWGPREKSDAPYPRAASLIQLAEWSEVLAIACHAGPATQGLISAPVLEALGPTGLLVNVARGSVVDEPALRSALTTGRLGAAALDVFAAEPTPPDLWRDVPNLYLTPHSAGATQGAVRQMLEAFNANLSAFLAGRPLVTPAPA